MSDPKINTATGDRLPEDSSTPGTLDEKSLTNLLDNPMIAVIVTDSDDKIRVFNLGAERIFKYQAADVVGRRAEALLWVTDENFNPADTGSNDFWQSLQDEGRTVEVTGRRRGGEIFPMELSANIATQNGERHLVLMALDLTRFKTAEQSLRASEANYRTLMEQASDGIIVTDPEGHIQVVNESACALACYPRDKMLAMQSDMLWPAEEGDRFAGQLGALSPGDSLRIEMNLRRSDGYLTPVELSGKLLDDGRLQAIIRDISERKHVEEELRFHATMDTLTHSYNRRYFLVLAEREFRRCMRLQRPISAMMLDLDHFKDINDSHGHAAGDDVLRAVAEAAQSNLREIDLFGRFGGEEFAAILPETNIATAQIVAERLRDSIGKLVVATEGVEIGVTVSIGVTESMGGVADVAGLIKRADSALYAAKDAGRNRVEVQTGGNS